MFKSKISLSSTLGQVNKFISDLKEGVASHEKEIDSVNENIKELESSRTSLENECAQAHKLIGILDGNNS